MTFILPGAEVPVSSSPVTFGPGIASAFPRSAAGPSGESTSVEPVFVATRAGRLARTQAKSKDKDESVWVEGRAKRYVPAQRDIVLGTIIARHAEGYRVDLGSAHMAQLDALAFEGATKRSKPNLKVGTLVYARVSLANRDMEPELECVDPATGRAEGFGELKGGVVVECSLQLCRKLLSPKHPLLPSLAQHIPFETAIGLNGRVWFKAEGVSQGIALRRVVEMVDAGEVGEDEVGRVVKELLA